MPDRSEAWELLCEYTKGDSLRKHALAVEAAMRACAKRYNEGPADEDEWGLVGLLHDFDYEMFPTPDQHPFTGSNILCGRGYSDRIIRAILGHATYTGVPRDTDMARALFATDELCGFLVACALVRPSKSLDDMEVSSVKKKLKDKHFARSVNREDIRQGVAELGVELFSLALARDSFLCWVEVVSRSGSFGRGRRRGEEFGRRPARDDRAEQQR